MITTYEKEFQILVCTSNSAGKMGPAEAFGLFQDITTEHSLYMNTDYNTMREKSNTFWAITKAKIHFNREPRFLENVTVRSWPNSPTAITGNRNYIITGADGEPAVTGVSEWVLMDISTRRLRRFNSTCYPIDVEHCNEKLFDIPFHRIHCDFSNESYVYSHIVRASDVDIVGHTNNTVYCRLMMNAFPARFFIENTITDFEVRYSIESRECDELRIYKKQENNTYYLAIKNAGGIVITTAALTIA